MTNKNYTDSDKNFADFKTKEDFILALETVINSKLPKKYGYIDHIDLQGDDYCGLKESEEISFSFDCDYWHWSFILFTNGTAKIFVTSVTFDLDSKDYVIPDLNWKTENISLVWSKIKKDLDRFNKQAIEENIG